MKKLPWEMTALEMVNELDNMLGMGKGGFARVSRELGGVQFAEEAEALQASEGEEK